MIVVLSESISSTDPTVLSAVNSEVRYSTTTYFRNKRSSCLQGSSRTWSGCCMLGKFLEGMYWKNVYRARKSNDTEMASA